MSMTTRAHPDPERLAALAGADRDALSDRELIAHVAECAACDGQVRDLRVLRAALAELPDLVPSRPLRLLPPVSKPTQSAGWRIGLRHAFAPLVVAGMVLLLVGGVGATGVLGPADAGSFFQRIQFSAPAAMEAATGQPQETAGAAGMAPDEVASPEGSRGQIGAIATDSPRAADASAAPTESLAEMTAGEDTSRDGDLAMVEDRAGWILAALAGVGLLALALVLRRTAVPIDRASSGR
jgi:hypothetical protein